MLRWPRRLTGWRSGTRSSPPDPPVRHVERAASAVLSCFWPPDLLPAQRVQHRRDPGLVARVVVLHRRVVKRQCEALVVLEGGGHGPVFQAGLVVHRQLEAQALAAAEIHRDRKSGGGGKE